MKSLLVLGILIVTIIAPKQNTYVPVIEETTVKSDYIEEKNISRGNYERKTIEYTATAYCSCEKCCGKWAKYNKTASGTTPKEGRTIAVDKNVIPLGSKVYIEGYGYYIAEDTGSAIKGNRIDIYFESHQEALNFGRRKVQISWEEN